MGGAMLKGWIRAGILSPEQSAACTRRSTNASNWQQEGLEVRPPALSIATQPVPHDHPILWTSKLSPLCNYPGACANRDDHNGLGPEDISAIGLNLRICCCCDLEMVTASSEMLTVRL